MKNVNIKKCAVIGAGIQGLYTAYQLAQKGYKVTIFTTSDPLKTTSTAAGAIWMLYKVYPEAKTIEWGIESLKHYHKLAENKKTGIVFRNHTEFFDEKIERPAWMNITGLGTGEAYDCIKPDNVFCSHSVKIPVIDSCRLISYLLGLLEGLSVEIIKQPINHFQELTEFKYLINTTGVGAAQLAKDSEVYPVKGQTFSLPQPTKPITQSLFYQTNALKTLIVPHADKVMIGITYNENDSSTNYDLEEEKKLIQSACSFYPALTGSAVLSRHVGHRPGRKEVRLEHEVVNGQHIIHNYGHGGAGITLAPGCASAILQLIEEDLNKL